MNIYIWLHFAPQFSFLVVFKIIYFWASTLEWVVLGSCTGQQTGTDTALPVISPGGAGSLPRLLDDGWADLATGDTDRRRWQNRRPTLDLRAGEAVQVPEEVVPQVLLPPGHWHSSDPNLSYCKHLPAWAQSSFTFNIKFTRFLKQMSMSLIKEDPGRWSSLKDPQNWLV